MNQTEKINPEEMKRSWHAQQEDILKDWSEQASCYRWMMSGLIKFIKNKI